MKKLSRKIHNFCLKKVISITIFFISGVLFFSSSKSHAWSGRGHNTVCEAASFLVKNKELKKFLQGRPHIMGHLCNIPDIQWKNEGDYRAVGDAAHYIDPEILGFTPKTLPLDLEKLKKDFTGKESKIAPNEKIFSVPRQLGSAYWRVEELMNNLAELKKDFTEAKIPQNKSEEQNRDLPFNKATYTFMTTAGIMGHYVGDLAQPYHNTSDHDGYESGHGGIHSYYEELVVNEIDGDLLSKVIKSARSQKHPEWMNGSLLERIRNFSAAAYADIGKIKKLDPIIKKSELKIEKGMSIKSPAVRKNPAEVVKKFEPLIVTHMGRGAWMLAQLWDEAFESMGKPQLSSYKSYQYPFTVDFIYPHYDVKTVSGKNE
jgi:hypothetical protein